MSKRYDPFLKNIKGVSKNDGDRMAKLELKSGMLLVKFLFSFLILRKYHPFSNILFVPMKVRFFAWKATWGRILTIGQLKKKGLNLGEQILLV